ncbi:hypothetical protein [Sutcliffiella horikoshii]
MGGKYVNKEMECVESIPPFYIVFFNGEFFWFSYSYLSNNEHDILIR